MQGTQRSVTQPARTQDRPIADSDNETVVSPEVQAKIDRLKMIRLKKEELELEMELREIGHSATGE